MLLMIYMNEDTDFSQVGNYLERQLQFTILQKYKYYSK